MTVRGWYDPAQEYFVINFLDEPSFDVSPLDVGKEESWAMFTHGVCAVSFEGGHIHFHTLRIPVSRMEKPGEMGLAERLEKAARVLEYMSKNGNFHVPGNPTSRQCLLAADALNQHFEMLMGEFRNSYHFATGEVL